jgi:hypothetical protein
MLALALVATGCGKDSPKLQISAKDTQLSAGTRPTSPANPVRSGNPGTPAVDASRITKGNYDKIQVGMTEKQVIDLLGQPSSEAPMDDGKARVLTWQVEDRWISATFRGGKLSVLNSANLREP